MKEQPKLKPATVCRLLKKYAQQIQVAQEAFEQVRKRCPHENVRFYPDPSGNNDSSFTCTDCGLSFRWDPRPERGL